MKASSLSEPRLEAWRKYYVSFWRVIPAIESELAAAGLPSLSWYDALYQLYLAPERRLRMSELAHGALLSRSGLTRLVDRLEKEGLLVRRSCPSDGRGQHAELTDKGLEMLRRIWPAYRAGIARHFGEYLTEADARHLAAILGPIAGSPAQA